MGRDRAHPSLLCAGVGAVWPSAYVIAQTLRQPPLPPSYQHRARMLLGI